MFRVLCGHSAWQQNPAALQHCEWWGLFVGSTHWRSEKTQKQCMALGDSLGDEVPGSLHVQWVLARHKSQGPPTWCRNELSFWGFQATSGSMFGGHGASHRPSHNNGSSSQPASSPADHCSATDSGSNHASGSGAAAPTPQHTSWRDAAAATPQHTSRRDAALAESEATSCQKCTLSERTTAPKRKKHKNILFQGHPHHQHPPDGRGESTRQGGASGWAAGPSPHGAGRCTRDSGLL